jgi:carboxymethylenebutenolidase
VRFRGLVVLLTLLWVPGARGAEESTLLTTRGTTPRVWGALRIPKGQGPHPAVILLHGSSGWRPEYVDIAQRFADSGFAALALDYHAETGGAAIGSAEKLQKWESWRRAVRDASRYLQTLPSVTGNRVALVGFSRGAFLAVSVAASMPSVIAVVDFFGGGGGGTLPMEEEVKGLPPLLILHGEKDTVVPVSFAHALQAAILEAGGEVEMHLFPEAGHAFNATWADAYSEETAEQAFVLTLAFLGARLGG